MASNLPALADAVAQDIDVDWSIAESTASPEDQRAIRQLQLVATLGQAARTLQRRWGAFELRGEIGRGAFGVVFRAWDSNVGREVALKILNSECGQSLRAGEAIHEARLLGAVDHPNVVPVHGAAVHDGQIGIWMRLVEGATLKDLLQERGPFGADEAAQIGRELCGALSAVHQAGLVHRDIKAQNVMRETGGRIVLMDFGASDAAHTGTARVKGSPAYLAPEIVDGAEPSVASDVYSLGVLLFYLVSGTFPVRASAWEEFRAWHRAQRSVPLRDARPDVPDWYERAVASALAPSPSERPASAGALSRMLLRPEGIPSSHAVTRTPEPSAPAPRGRSYLGRGTTLVAMAFVATMTLLSILGKSLWQTDAAVSPRLLVMPFTALSGGDDTAYLAEAVSLELTSLLARDGTGSVVPWAYARQLPPGQAVGDAGKESGADIVIAGTVQPKTDASGTLLRVHVQILRASTGIQFWSTTLDRQLGDFFALQSELASQLSRNIRTALARREQLAPARGRHLPDEAVEYYLKGRLSWESYEGGFDTAIGLFRKAIEIAPQFPEAHAALAECFALQHAYSGTVSAGDALARVLESADRAIALDATMSDAWATRAFAKLALAWDWSGAERDYAEARRLNPDSPTVAASYANYLITMGRTNEAVDVSRAALERSPLSPLVSRKLAWSYYVARRYAEAVAELERTLRIDSTYEPALTLLARTYALMGHRDLALATIRSVSRPGFEAIGAQVLALTGDTTQATAILRSLTDAQHTGPLLRYQIAAAYAVVGDADLSLRWLRTAIESNDSGVALLAVDPMFDSIRDSPEFQRILVSLGLG